MTLHLIGLGLGDETDITVRGLEIVRQADLVLLEAYTSILCTDKTRLEKLYGKRIELANRTMVELHAEERILKPAQTKEVAFLVVGDPFGATTHLDLLLRARELGVQVEVVHNASIMNSIGEIGLDLYKYGRTTSLPFPEQGYTPESPYDAIGENKKRGLHTLVLLDIKMDEPSKKALLHEGGTKDNSARFMDIPLALQTLLAIEERRREGIVTPETSVVGIARLGSPGKKIVVDRAAELRKTDFGGPLHCLVIPGKLHHIEQEALRQWRAGHYG